MTDEATTPCDCGSLDAAWHGPEEGLRAYCCASCWRHAPENAERAALGRHRGFRAAYMKGLHAALAGESIDACPYVDKRKPSGKLSWSRAFQNAWRDGWQEATTRRSQALITSRYAGTRA